MQLNPETCEIKLDFWAGGGVVGNGVKFTSNSNPFFQVARCCYWHFYFSFILFIFVNKAEKKLLFEPY